MPAATKSSKRASAKSNQHAAQCVFDLVKERLKTDSLEDDIAIALQEAKEHVEEENAAAIVLQRRARGYLARKQLHYMNAEATKIQAHFRGFRGRRRALVQRRLKELEEAENRFQRSAVLLQKHWRGLTSRRSTNLSSRRSYLNEIGESTHRLREQLKAYSQEQLDLERKQKIETLCKAAGRMHHMNLMILLALQQGVFKEKEVVGLELEDSNIEQIITKVYRETHKVQKRTKSRYH